MSISSLNMGLNIGKALIIYLAQCEGESWYQSSLTQWAVLVLCSETKSQQRLLKMSHIRMHFLKYLLHRNLRPLHQNLNELIGWQNPFFKTRARSLCEFSSSISYSAYLEKQIKIARLITFKDKFERHEKKFTWKKVSSLCFCLSFSKSSTFCDFRPILS